MDDSRLTLEKRHYFDWLCVQINGEDPEESYIQMLWVLFCRAYYWKLSLDSDREYDGLSLRSDFAKEADWLDLSDDFYNEPCSVLEMLIAFAGRIDHDVLGESDIPDPRMWFWRMVSNLGIDISDDYFKGYTTQEMINRAIDIWLSRAFKPDGSGGIFPIPETEKDQRNVEFWGQMHEYLIRYFM